MRRRELIAGLVGSAVARPVVSHAQRAVPPIVGFLSLGTPTTFSRPLTDFKRGLADAGYAEGRNIKIEVRWEANGPLPELAKELVQQQPAVIVANGGPRAVLAAMAATSTVPIVFSTSVDPVKYGFVASLNRPGGNVTGVAFLSSELIGKRLELLLKLVPQATNVAYLSASGSRYVEDLNSEVVTAAQALGREAVVIAVDRNYSFQSAFQALQDQQAGALMVADLTDFLEPRNRQTIVGLAARYKVPTMYPSRIYSVFGGLMSYSTDFGYLQQLGAQYVGAILMGTKPADLPVQRPTRFQLVFNLKTAKALGLTIPPNLLAIADEVIE
jgi:putative tryptophan/tyrosine transport system substrate-binding protein